jgi:hypothetical protein
VTTICDPGSGDVCDPPESCTGTPLETCPVDVVASATTICRTEAGDCDVAESCTGVADAACPADAFDPVGTACGLVNECEVPGICTGNDPQCPGGFEPAGTACGDPADRVCDDPDTCDAAGTCLDNSVSGCQASRWEVDIDLSYTGVRFFGAGIPIVATGTGVAGAGTFSTKHLSELRLADGISGSVSVPITDPDSPVLNSVIATAELGTGTLSDFDGTPPPLNKLAAPGSIRLCLLVPGCTTFIPLPFTRLATRGVGLGGMITVNGFGTINPGWPKFSIYGAPWTIGTASLQNVTTETPNGGVTTYTMTIQGFVHSPASSTSSTVSTNGMVQLVTPALIETSLGSPHNYLALMGVLRVLFIPEPGQLLLLTVGVAGLCLLGRRRMRH